MKAVRIYEYGPSVDVLHYEQTALPDIHKNQVLVKVWATSVNHLEVGIASGKMKEAMPVHFPWIPGFDGSGIVDRVGEHVHDVDPGDEVYFKCPGGSYAEYIVLDRYMLHKKPFNLTLTEAATVPHTGLTAWQALFNYGNLKKGQTVLIHGGAGAVGTFAIQFAKKAGAIVYTTASANDISFTESLGADMVINYREDDFTAVFRDVDLVIDLVGEETQRESYSIIKPGGRLVTTAGPVDQEEADKNDVTAVSMVVKPDKDDLEQMTEFIESNRIRTDVAITFRLDEVKRAWETYEHKTPGTIRFTHGKIVLEMK